jgi:predicted transcriptional regulator
MNTSTALDHKVAQVVAGMLDETGISRKQTSEATGIPRATLLRRLNGSSFQLTELRAIAELLDTTITEIVSRAEVAA